MQSSQQNHGHHAGQEKHLTKKAPLFNLMLNWTKQPPGSKVILWLRATSTD
jgi:hypothetical protein